MKYSVSKIVICTIMLVLSGVMVGCKEDIAVVQVNDIISDPGAFSKPLNLEGIVYSYAKGDTSIVGVMDKKELQCNSPNCNKNLIAVKVPGSQLAIGDEIKAFGSITKESWGYILKAEMVEVITRHKLGA